MARIAYDSDKMFQVVIPKLHDAHSNINRAIESSSQLNIPRDFVNYTYMENLNYNIKKINNELELIMRDIKLLTHEQDKEVSLILHNIRNIR